MHTASRRLLRASLAALVLALPACDTSSSLTPPETESLDAELRRLIAGWGGVMPIGPVPVQDPAKVELGRALFFDKILSGNKDMSCATCHDPALSLTDGMSLAVGTAGVRSGTTRQPGPGREFVPRNAPTLLNQGLGFFYTLWDGRINEEFVAGGRFKSPVGIVLPSGLDNLIAAQAMLPILSRVEMRGVSGDVDRDGQPNELAVIADSTPAAVWHASMQRLLAIDAYVAMFRAAYPGTLTTALGFQHAANALAAFQTHAFTRTRSPFDRYLARDDRALSDDEKRGAILFFGRARCANCHNGALLGGRQFANVGVPQLGPGVGAAAPLDVGRGEHVPLPAPEPAFNFYNFAFRVPPLRNVELTAPYMHNGAYPTLAAVVRHYANADSAHRNYDVAQLDPALRATHRNDATTIDRVLTGLDFNVRSPLRLTPTEQQLLVAFLKSLTDPSARDLSSVIPASVPSGLPVRE